MVKVLHVFILLMCCVFNNSQNIGLPNYLNHEIIEDIKLVDETICPKPQPCYTPLKYDVKYRCGSDVTCPLGFKCCRGDCFIHKVCVQPDHVNKLQVLELPTAENSSLPKTITFDISNATLLNDVKVNLSANLMQIFANQTGEAIFDNPESLISLAAILPLLKNNTYLKESVKEYDHTDDEILEPKPLSKYYESTEKSVNIDVVNNDIINIDDAINNSLEIGDSSATTIRTIYVEEVKKSDDSDYSEGSGDYGIVSSTSDYIKKEIDGSGDHNIQTDGKSKYEEGSSDNEETAPPSSVNAFTEKNYFTKEYDGSGDYSQETDEQSKSEQGMGDKKETRTTSSVVSSTSKEVENNEYSKTHHHSRFKNIKSAIIKIKNLNRTLKTYKNHFDGFEDDSDYSEGSGTDEDVVGSGDFHEQNENKNISALVKLIKNKRLFRHAAHYWKQLSRIEDDNEDEGSGSGSGDGATISSEENIDDGYSSMETSSISSSTDDASTVLVSSSTHQVREPKKFIGLEDDYYYDLQEDEMTTITNQIPIITISSISTTFSLEDSKITEDFIDIDGDSTTSDAMSTIQDVYSITTLEGSGNSDDDIISSGDDDYEGSGTFEETETSRIPGDKPRGPISVNPTQTTALVNDVKEYSVDVIPAVSATSSESEKEYALPEKNNSTINQEEIQKESSVANDIKAALDMMKENVGFKPDVSAVSSEPLEQHALPKNNIENTTDSILKSIKMNAKEIQKESSVDNNAFKIYKEDKFETTKRDKVISAAKAALDMMKESTGLETDDYYEDDS